MSDLRQSIEECLTCQRRILRSIGVINVYSNLLVFTLRINNKKPVMYIPYHTNYDVKYELPVNMRECKDEAEARAMVIEELMEMLGE